MEDGLDPSTDDVTRKFIHGAELPPQYSLGDQVEEKFENNKIASLLIQSF